LNKFKNYKVNKTMKRMEGGHSNMSIFPQVRRDASRAQRQWAEQGMRSTTIARNLRHLKAALRWAERQGMMHAAPRIEMPTRDKSKPLAKARAVTTEEYERMLLAVPKVRPDDAADWQFFISALWATGLRRDEALRLNWDGDAALSLDLSFNPPCMHFAADSQKSNRAESVPLTAEALALFQQVPADRRQGPVFRLLDLWSKKPLDAPHVGRVVGRIGVKASVVTNKAENRYAGCHDLRRGFCAKWAKRVMPAVLRQLARHANVGTTLAYYAEIGLKDLAAEIGRFPADGNTLATAPTGRGVENNIGASKAVASETPIDKEVASSTGGGT
jgi:integrase